MLLIELARTVQALRITSVGVIKSATIMKVGYQLRIPREFEGRIQGRVRDGNFGSIFGSSPERCSTKM